MDALVNERLSAVADARKEPPAGLTEEQGTALLEEKLAPLAASLRSAAARLDALERRLDELEPRFNERVEKAAAAAAARILREEIARLLAEA